MGRDCGATIQSQLNDILRVQEEISQEIVERLCLHLTSVQRKQLTKKYTSNIVAYQHYLRGRYQWSKRTAAGFKRGCRGLSASDR